MLPLCGYESLCMCLWPLARGLFRMTGGDWRCWSLTLLDLKLNGQINRCCHLLQWNHLLVSTPIRWQHLLLIDTSICPEPWCQSLTTNQDVMQEKQISEMTYSKTEEKVLANYILLILQFYDVSILTAEFARKVTWSMTNWVPILFEMAKIKSQGNLEGQSKQGRGLKGRNRKEPVAVSVCEP